MRTRFAPSPTGFLHVGGLRTALYSFLLARQSKGKFLLRIEDTDQTRYQEGAVENILRTLKWADLNPEEGVILDGNVASQRGDKGPYFQSQRLEMYRAHAEQLMKSGHAYRCFCTSARLDEMRKLQQERGQPPMYDRTCLKLSDEEIKKKMDAGEPHVVRMKVPHEETITFTDDIRGPLSFQGHTIDDQVLLKSDGWPTYHLAHVVDDHFMEIDLVLRGEEWLSSLPKHLLLFEFLGWPAPRYAHVSLLLNADRSKLSKRQGDVAAEDYMKKGYLPEALLNFIALLGWNPGTTQELFSLSELIEAFSLDRVQKAGAIFDTQKLDWLQGQWMRKMSKEEFVRRIRPLVAEKFPAAATDELFHDRAAQIQDRITFFHEAPDMLAFFYEEPTASVELMANKKQKIEAAMLPDLLHGLIETLEKISDNDWKHEILEKELRALMETRGWKLGQILWPLRSALTGREFSPGAFEVASALGKEMTMKRLRAALTVL